MINPFKNRFAPYCDYGGVMKSYNKHALKLLNATTLKKRFPL